MLWLGLKLLGIGKYIKQFFFANWKWLVPLLLVLGGFLWTKEHYYNLGTSTERTIWEARVEEERLRNEKLTNQLLTTVTNFAAKVDERNNARTSSEVIHDTRIETIVKDNPVYMDCKVDQEVLDEQNALKALGPK